jgi:hypothetical protein
LRKQKPRNQKKKKKDQKPLTASCISDRLNEIAISFFNWAVATCQLAATQKGLAANIAILLLVKRRQVLTAS